MIFLLVFLLKILKKQKNIEDVKYVKEMKERRKRAMETWKKEDIEVRDVTEEWNARWMKKKKYKEVFM